MLPFYAAAPERAERRRTESCCLRFRTRSFMKRVENMTNTNDTLKWVAGGIFAFGALLSLVDFIQYHPSGFGWVLLNLLELVAFVVITVGIFANVKILTSVGGGIMALSSICYILFVNLVSIINGYMDGFVYILTNLLSVIAFVMIAFLPMAKKSAKMVGIAAGGVYFLRVIITVVHNYIEFDFFMSSWIFWLFSLTVIGGAVVAGLYYGSLVDAPAAPRAVPYTGYGAYPYGAPNPNAYGTPNAAPGYSAPNYAQPNPNPYGTPNAAPGYSAPNYAQPNPMPQYPPQNPQYPAYGQPVFPNAQQAPYGQSGVQPTGAYQPTEPPAGGADTQN